MYVCVYICVYAESLYSVAQLRNDEISAFRSLRALSFNFRRCRAELWIRVEEGNPEILSNWVPSRSSCSNNTDPFQWKARSSAAHLIHTWLGKSALNWCSFAFHFMLWVLLVLYFIFFPFLSSWHCEMERIWKWTVSTQNQNRNSYASSEKLE